MVPFMKTSAETGSQKAKVLAAEIRKMSFFDAANDDKFHVTYYNAMEAYAANE